MAWNQIVKYLNLSLIFRSSVQILGKPLSGAYWLHTAQSLHEDATQNSELPTSLPALNSILTYQDATLDQEIARLIR